MKAFDSHGFDLEKCRRELTELEELLESSDDLGEADQILPFFRERRDLSALLGLYNNKITRFDRLAFEFDIFGDFVADLVVGDSKRCAFNFVEFEDARPSSLFVKKAGKATREWSARFDPGYGQIIDWFYKINDRGGSDEFETRFGERSIDFLGTLVIGRDQHMDRGEKLRLEWRRRHVIVNSKQIVCVTFDELLEHLRTQIAVFSQAAQTEDS